MPIRPTLIIGAGGTGYETVVRIKARFEETFPGEAMEQIRYIVFDTDIAHSPVLNTVGKPVSLTPDIELIQIGGVPVTGIIENRQNYTAVVNELEIDKLPRLDLTKGAKQVRQLGRLAFFYHFERISSILTSAIRQILNIAHQGGGSAIQAINVFFVSSVCGGTGSGFIIDLGYLTRHLASINGIPEDRIFNIATLILPEAFKVPLSSKAQIRANATATLTEIDHFAVHGDFEVLYPNGSRLVDKKPPFNITYLVDAINENGQTVEDMGQLAPILAEALFLHAGTTLGGGVDSAFDNVISARGGDKNGFIKTYSMIGAATLRFNALRMQRACGLRLARHLMRDQLAKPLSPFQIEQERVHNPIHPDLRIAVTDLMSGIHCANLTALREELRQMPGQKTMLISVNTDIHDQAELQAMVSRCEKQLNNYAQSMVYSEFATQIERNRLLITGEATEKLAEELYFLCDQLESGVPKAYAFLTGVLEALNPLRQQLKTQRQEIDQDRVRLQKEIKNARAVFEEATQSFTFWGLNKGAIRRTRRLYSQAYLRDLNHQLDLILIENSFAFLNAIEKKAEELLTAVGTLLATLNRIGNKADNELSNLESHWGTAYVTEENIDSKQDIRRYYDRYMNHTLQNEARTLLSKKSLSDWLKDIEKPVERYSNRPSPDQELETQFLKQTIDIYSRIVEEESLERQLGDRYGDDTKKQNEQLEKLIKLSSPFSNYMPAEAGLGSEDLDPILVIGVKDKSRSIFSNVGIRNASFVSTFDDQRISVLHTKHGLPLHALRQYPEYRRHYATLSNRAGQASYLCYKIVMNESVGNFLFMQGESYGLIQIKGVTGYFFMRDNEEDGIFLGENLLDAVRKVIGDSGIRGELQKKVDEIRSHRMPKELMTLLEAYLKRETRNPRYLHQELQSLAEAEFQRLQTRDNS